MKSKNFTLILLITFALIQNASAQLSGIKTIGGTTPDYTTVADAVVALQTLGVNGPIIFNIRPGTYSGKADLGIVAGTSATNTIIFKAENNDSTSVIITDTASLTGANYTFHVFGTDYLTIRNVTISRTGANTNSTVISIGSNSRFFQLRNCIIESDVTTGTANTNAQIYFPLGGTSDSSITFENNIFRGGSMGLYVQGQGPAATIPIMQIKNNQFIDQSSRAMQLTYLNSPDIQGNTITTQSINTAYRGIILRRVNGDFTVTSNRILGSAGNPLQFDTCNGSSGNEALIANNFLQAQGTTAVRGIFVSNCSFLNFYHNTVNITAINLTAAAFFINNQGLSSALNVRNNIFVNTGGGVTFSLTAGGLGGLATSNNNDLFVSPSSAFLAILDTADLATLADWQTASSKDANSVSADPEFISTTDLHAGSSGVNDLATFIASVPTDIDGQSRSVTRPDLGADEVTPLKDNIGVLAFLEPANVICGDSSISVAVLIRNYGLGTQNGFTVKADVSGSLTQTLSEVFASNLTTNEIDTVFFTQTLNTYSGGTIVITAYTELTGDQYTANDTISASFTFGGHPNPPVVISPQPQCDNNLQITATPDSGDVLAWYDQPVGGTLLFTGNVFSPVVSTDTTFYVESRTGSGTAGCLRITEIEPNDNPSDFIEIQNLSGVGFDATGWKVIVNANYDDTASLATTWDLGYFNAGEAQYKTDNASDNYWGVNLLWSGGLGSWAMIVDDHGNIVDFVVWDWDTIAIPLPTMVISYNNVNYTIGTEWSGAGYVSCVNPDNNQRIGNQDNNNASDWGCAVSNRGVTNVNLSGTFVNCGIGACGSPRQAIDVTLIPGIFTNLGNDTMLGTPFSITLDAGPGFGAYQWSTGETTQSIVVDTHGTYWVTIIDSAGGCSYTDSINILLNVGMSNIIGEDEISLYPNPATDKLMIRGFESVLSTATIRVTDIEGRVVDLRKVKKSDKEFILDLNNLNEGIYFLQIISGDRTGVKKFSVIR